jgi:hypothetical protein
MSELHLHIVSFDIPYPANYGGVIDVFYKIKALHTAGVKVHLHCFKYHREPAPELEVLCHEVHYYPRKTGLASALTWKPYIVIGRRSNELLKRLCQDNYPILFEGLHTCYYISHPSLQHRVKIYRESNIEHHYYFHLSKAEKNPVKKLYFFFSGLKLRSFQKILIHSSLMLTVSREDQQYLKSQFPGNKVEYLPSFHHDDTVSIFPGQSDFALYHGNLSVGENIRAAEHLIKNVFSGSPVRFIIAGMDPPSGLREFARKHSNVTLYDNPTDQQMFNLIRSAQINILITFQPTGLKLKLLNALFNGRFCVVNREMVAGTEVGQLCEICSGDRQLREKVEELMKVPFTDDMVWNRKNKLMKWHSNRTNCGILVNFISLLYNPSP